MRGSSVFVPGRCLPLALGLCALVELFPVAQDTVAVGAPQHGLARIVVLMPTGTQLASEVLGVIDVHVRRPGGTLAAETRGGLSRFRV